MGGGGSDHFKKNTNNNLKKIKVEKNIVKLWSNP